MPADLEPEEQYGAGLTMAASYGSYDNPYVEFPFDRITEVHWAGGGFAIGTSTSNTPASLLKSSDGATWETNPFPTEMHSGGTITGLCYAQGTWMICGQTTFDGSTGLWTKAVFSSTDFATWTKVYEFEEGSTAVAGLAAGSVSVPDGSGGMKMQTTFVLAIGGLYEGGGFVNNSSDISRLMTSTDNGSHWTSTHTGDPRNTFVAVNFCKDAFYACSGDNSGSFRTDPSAGGNLWRSTDGQTWTHVSNLPGSIGASDSYDSVPASAFILGAAYDATSGTYAAVGVQPLKTAFGGTGLDVELDEVMFGASTDGIDWRWTALSGYGPPVISSVSIAGGGGYFASVGQRYATLGIDPYSTPYYAVAFKAPAGGAWSATNLDIPAVEPPSPGNSQSFGGATIYNSNLSLFAIGAVGQIQGGSESIAPVRKIFTSDGVAPWVVAYTINDNPSGSGSFGSQVTCGAIGAL
jgi:hypothetical protein